MKRQPPKALPIEPNTPLPVPLARLRKHWLDDAKALNGNCLCLVPVAPTTIVFRYQGQLYELRRESICMDEDAFEVSFEEILRDLERLGCEIVAG